MKMELESENENSRDGFKHVEVPYNFQQYLSSENCNIQVLCRTCLAIDPEEMHPLLSSRDTCMLAEMFTALTSIPVDKDDGLPTNVCSKCHNFIIKCYEFRTQCEKANYILKSILSRKSIPIAEPNEQNKGPFIQVKIESDPDIEVKEEISTDEVAHPTEFVEFKPSQNHSELSANDSSSLQNQSSSENSSNEEDINEQPRTPELSEEQTEFDSTLPSKSKEKYMMQYQNFLQWRNSKRTDSLSESLFMTYFKELSKKYKPSSLWCIFSMLKTTVWTKNGVDIKTYRNLINFLKISSDGYNSKKSKVLSLNDIEKFLTEAPDNRYLATKVALIFGITGACKRQELNNITTRDIENHGKMLLVKITNENNKIPRSFTIQGPFYEIVKKYESLRSTKAKTDRFFQNFQNGKCTSQPIGVNKFGSMPKEIAKYLGLPDADSYTGHSFKRTSVTLLAHSEADLLCLKRFGKRKSKNVAESYAKNKTDKDETEINVKHESKRSCKDPCPSTSTSNDLHAPSFTDEESFHLS